MWFFKKKAPKKYRSYATANSDPSKRRLYTCNECGETGWAPVKVMHYSGCLTGRWEEERRRPMEVFIPAKPRPFRIPKRRVP